jgi:hypothetical protein
MPSTAIKDLAYDQTRRELAVTFVTGRRYIYFEVSPDEFRAFQRARSKGQFFNTRVRDRYRFERVRDYPPLK